MREKPSLDGCYVFIGITPPHEIQLEEYYDDEPEQCDHEDYREDILTGACDCWRCGARWYRED